MLERRRFALRVYSRDDVSTRCVRNLQELSCWSQRRKINTQAMMSSGEYLPLSVWVARGWDSAMVERGCDDWCDDEKLGSRLYKMVVTKTKDTAAETYEVGERLEGKSKPKSKANPSPRSKAKTLPHDVASWNEEQHKGWLAKTLETLTPQRNTVQVLRSTTSAYLDLYLDLT